MAEDLPVLGRGLHRDLRRKSMKSERESRRCGFEPAVSASERPQTHALDRAATAICFFKFPVVPIIASISPVCASSVNMLGLHVTMISDQ